MYALLFCITKIERWKSVRVTSLQHYTTATRWFSYTIKMRRGQTGHIHMHWKNQRVKSREDDWVSDESVHKFCTIAFRLILELRPSEPKLREMSRDTFRIRKFTNFRIMIFIRRSVWLSPSVQVLKSCCPSVGKKHRSLIDDKILIYKIWRNLGWLNSCNLRMKPSLIFKISITLRLGKMSPRFLIAIKSKFSTASDSEWSKAALQSSHYKLIATVFTTKPPIYTKLAWQKRQQLK